MFSTSTGQSNRLRSRIDHLSSAEGQLLVINVARLLVSMTQVIVAIGVPIYFAADGISASQLGLIIGLTAVFSVSISTLIGTLSDRIGRRPFLIVYPILIGLAVVTFVITSYQPLLIGATVVGGFGRGGGAGAGQVGAYQPAESALLSDIAVTNRNRAFMKVSQFNVIGALLGSLAALFFYGNLSGPKSKNDLMIPFVIAAISAIGAGLSALLLKDVNTTKAKRALEIQNGNEYGNESSEKNTIKRSILPKNSMPLLLRLFLTNSLNGLAVGMFGPFLTYYFYVRFHEGPNAIAFVYLLTNVLSLGPISTATKWAGKSGIIKVTTILRVIQALLLIPFALAPNYVLAASIFVLRTVVQRAALPLRTSYVQSQAHPDERAQVAALSNISAQIMQSGSPVLAGFLFDQVAFEAPFIVGGLVQLLSAIFYGYFFMSRPPADEL
ncbi:MAG: MFS transporter [Actinomycetota bacterium]|nr:MFS transporter [Actinomycetota bacterium]